LSTDCAFLPVTVCRPFSEIAFIPDAAPLMLEAANELEQLRTEVARLRREFLAHQAAWKVNNHWHANELDTLREENVRLQAQLKDRP
jgi:hypothetical protein